MATPAELQAQLALINKQLAAIDKPLMEAIIASLAEPGENFAAARAALAAGVEGFQNPEAKKRATELLNVLTIIPGLLTTISGEIDAAYAYEPPPAPADE